VGFLAHFNKGLAGASAAEIEAARDTATNPDVLDAFALLITGSNDRAFPGVQGHDPDLDAARRNGVRVRKCMDEILKALHAPDPTFRKAISSKEMAAVLLGIELFEVSVSEKEVRSGGLFFVHHGVGSEEWSADGFIARRDATSGRFTTGGNPTVGRVFSRVSDRRQITPGFASLHPGFMPSSASRDFKTLYFRILQPKWKKHPSYRSGFCLSLRSNVLSREHFI
jgi:hypothetical protein